MILGCLMTDASTTPDPIELTRSFYETMDREWDFFALAGFFAPDAVWDLSGSHLGIYEGVGAIGDFLVGYWETWEDHHHEIEGMLDFGDGVLSVAIREDGCLNGINDFGEIVGTGLHNGVERGFILKPR